MVEVNGVMSIRRQCELLGLNRGSYYYEPELPGEASIKLMHMIDVNGRLFPAPLSGLKTMPLVQFR